MDSKLSKKILFTLFALVVFRLGVNVPAPGIDAAALRSFLESNTGTAFSWFNMFGGGALERFSILALNIVPYISSSIIFQLLGVVVPSIGELAKEGEAGRRKINQYTRYATLALALVQGYGLAAGLEQLSRPSVVLEPGILFRVEVAITLAAGTLFLMWLGELITEFGLGNGSSLIIFAGIASSVPKGVGSLITLVRVGEIKLPTLVLLTVGVGAAFCLIVFFERAFRKVLVHYPKRVVGNKVYGGQPSHLPLKINVSGVIHPIYASSILRFPATVMSVFPNRFSDSAQRFLQVGGLLHETLNVSLIVFFCFFYAAVVFKSGDVADNLKRVGGFIPGIRPGEKTASFLDQVLARLTLGGAFYISTVAVVPQLVMMDSGLPFAFGGTSLLILVGVAMDTLSQFESQRLASSYGTLVDGVRLRGRGNK